MGKAEPLWEGVLREIRLGENTGFPWEAILDFFRFS
jgi:hypothetical protein